MNYQLTIKYLKKCKPETLQELYMETCKVLRRTYPESMETTPSERFFASEIAKSTKLKFYQSVWIGRYNYDILIPSIKASKEWRNYSFKGLVIEVNGGIHDREFKLLKDESKGQLLTKLNISGTTILNGDKRSEPVKSLINHLGGLPRLDWRGRQRVWQRIYIETLLSHQEIVQTLNIYKSLKTKGI